MPWAEEVLQAGQWRGEPAFVVGGGDSIRHRRFDLRRLEPFHSIAVNASWRHFRPELIYLADAHLLQLLEHTDEWHGLECPKLLHQSVVNEQRRFALTMEGCHLLRIAKSSVPWGRSLEEGLYGGNNSGVVALNLAEVLGASPIFLVGMDCRLGPSGRANYHDEYPSTEVDPVWERPTKDSFYDRFRRAFDLHAAPNARAKIYSGEDSRLGCFPKLSYDLMVEKAQALARRTP